MQATITVLKPRGILKLSVPGILDDEEMHRVIQILFKAAETWPSNDILVDTRRARSSLTGEELRLMVVSLGQHPAMRLRKLALVAAQERVEIVRVIESVEQRDGLAIRVFGSLEVAWDWLGDASPAV